MKNLGFLDPGSDHPDLAKGSKMELPFWMVEGLRSNQELDVIYLVFNFHREIMEANTNIRTTTITVDFIKRFKDQLLMGREILWPILG